MNPAALAGATRLTTPRAGWRYGVLGLALAFVALPLYVTLPSHYAGLGVPLASLGALLLVLRTADALADPWLGRVVDRLLARGGRPLRAAALAAGALLALGFQALMFPPVRGSGALLLWGGACLVLCYAGYSGLLILHQAWGARLGGDAGERARIVAWREGFGLAGVVVASVLPAALGLAATSAALAASLGGGLWALLSLPPAAGMRPPAGPGTSGTATPALRPTGEAAPAGPATPAPPHPLRHAAFRRLLAVYALNGVAAAVPATLVLFFINDRLQAPALAPALLALYFLAGAASLPLWVRAIARWGLLRCWAAGMALSVLAFVGTLGLGAGDGAAFALVCAATGLALGADLAAPPALLAGLIRAAGQHGRAEGAWFGWWTVATKLNLALAAGLALPLLQALGYQPGERDAAGLQALTLVYAGLPCGLKLAALASLRWLRVHEPRA